MQRSRLLLAALIASTAAAAPQGDVQIVHDPIDCWPIDQFLVVQPTFEPPADIQAAKFYFRSNTQPDYYYVELTLSRDGGRAIAPKAAPETAGVVYYIELVTTGFSSFRTEEHDVPVASGAECRRRDPEAAYYSGQNPDIAVGSTRFGVPQMPPGFQADGIARFINVSGVSGEAGAAGGISGKTIGIIAGAVGGAAVAALALGGGSDSATTTSGIGGVISSTTAISTSTAIGGGSSSTTTSVGGGGGTSSLTTTVPSSSSTTTAGSTTTSSTTTSVGSTTTSPTTTISSTTTTAAGSNADIRITKTDSADPVVVNQMFTYRIRVTNAGPATATGVGIQDDMPVGLTAVAVNAPCGLGRTIICQLGNIASGAFREINMTVLAEQVGTFTNEVLTAAVQPDPNMSNNTATQTTRVVSMLRTEPGGDPAGTFSSTLNLPSDHGIRARVVVNDTTVDETSNGAPFIHRFPTGIRRVQVQAHLEAVGPKEGTWTFDFSNAPTFVNGSITPQEGRVLALSLDSVVFSVGSEGEPPRFVFEVATETGPPHR